MHEKIVIGTYAEETIWRTCADVFYPIRAMSFITYFMHDSKKGTPMMVKVDQIRMTYIRRSVQLYETTVNAYLDKRIMKTLVKDQLKFKPSNGSGYIQPAAVLNALSLLSSGLALNSYLVGHGLEG